MTDRIAVILQARMGSTRLPGKVLADLSGKPLLSFLIERLQRCLLIDDIIIATTTNSTDDCIVNLAHSHGLLVARGSEQDVLSRFVQAADLTTARILVRITGDCPLIDPQVLTTAIELFRSSDVDYLNNFEPPSFPDGLDVEVFSRNALLLAQSHSQNDIQREHVTSWMTESGELRISTYQHSEDLSRHRWTVDEPEDLEVIRSVVSFFKGNSDFSWIDVLDLYSRNPEIFSANTHFLRNEGSSIGQGQKLWRRAKRVIPGGNMLLSKRPELFLPNLWPAYFSKAKGCYVWDLDGIMYIDMSIMGVGTNILGYGNPEVDEAVQFAISSGNLSTLNCPEEVWLAEKLVELHPWSDMVRFARTGGEANAIAIRIARAFTGRDTVAICGYHGWHDWYLASNLRDNSNLESHLLPGLNPIGVPNCLEGSTQPFNFNRFDELEHIASKHSLAAVKMEVQRSVPPNPDFLLSVRELCNRLGAVLIFDECTSGFRETFGGLHLKYDVAPDIAIFGKTLGNGYAITATIGKEEVMQAAQSSFISSTFWTERIGPSAALKTLEVMKRDTSWDTVTNLGLYMRAHWQALADRHDLSITQYGLPALCGFSFNSDYHLHFKTLISQQMLKNGYLADTSFYPSVSHNESIIDSYISHLDAIFSLISDCQRGRNIYDLLEGPVCHSGFKRLN